MSAIAQALRLVSEPPGSLVYHLVVLFALWAAGLAALAHWQRTRQPRAAALLVAAAGLLVLRGLLIATAALAWQGLMSPEVLLPPLDRAIATAEILFLVWALALPRQDRFAYVTLGALVFFTLVGFVAALTFWQPQAQAGLSYNNSTQETVWELVDLLGLGVGILLLAWHRPADWGFALALFGLMLVGHLGHYAYAPEGTHIAGAERLAQLAALPLFAVIALRGPLGMEAAGRRRPSPPEEKPTIKAPPASSSQLVSDLVALAANSSTEEPVLLAARTAARAVMADVCVVVHPGSDRSSAIVPGGYDLIRERPIAGGTLDLARLPTLASALQRGKAVRMNPDRYSSELIELAECLSTGQSGPALIVPLEHEGRNLGAVLAFSPYAQRSWTPDDQGLLMAVAQAITAAMARHSASVELAVKLEAAIARQEELARQLAQTQSAADQLAQALDEAQARNAAERERADGLALLIQEYGGLRDSQPQGDRLRLSQLEEELRSAREAIAALDVERADMAAVQIQAAEELDLLRFQLAEKSAEIERLQRQPQATPFVTSAEAGWAEAEVLKRQLTEALEANARLVGRLAEAERHLGEAEARAESSSESANGLPKTEVVASLARELRQPMSSVVGYTDLLLGESVGILGALQRKFLERVKVSADRVGALLDDLVRITAIDTGTLQLEAETVDVVALIDEAITNSGGQFREKNITLRMGVPDDLPAVHADRDALSQIMNHLLNNAARASNPDGEVVVSAQLQPEDPEREVGAFLLIAVTDSGSGIAPEDRARVFTRIYRADYPLIEGLGDTGVGLSIVKALVEAQGGRIWVDSETGVGSTFSLMLPVDSQHSINGSKDR